MSPVCLRRRLKARLLIFGFAGMSALASADDIDTLKRLADEGVPEAAYRLGYIYQVGEGVSSDFRLAETYLSRAVSGGSKDAILSLAHLYLNHQLLSYKQKGRSLLVDAFGAGIESAGLILADSYAKEKYIGDPSEALYWYSLMAERGHSVAAFNAGLLSLDPAAGNVDVGRAIEYFLLAFEQGEPEGARKVGDILRAGQYSFDEEDKNKPLFWYIKSAERGSGAAQYNLAYAYFIGDGVESDMTKAHYWAKLASESGDADGEHLLGILCKDGPRYCH